MSDVAEIPYCLRTVFSGRVECMMGNQPQVCHAITVTHIKCVHLIFLGAEGPTGMS